MEAKMRHWVRGWGYPMKAIVLPEYQGYVFARLREKYAIIQR